MVLLHFLSNSTFYSHCLIESSETWIVLADMSHQVPASRKFCNKLQPSIADSQEEDMAVMSCVTIFVHLTIFSPYDKSIVIVNSTLLQHTKSKSLQLAYLQHLWIMVPCSWLLSGATEIWRLRFYDCDGLIAICCYFSFSNLAEDYSSRNKKKNLNEAKH